MKDYRIEDFLTSNTILYQVPSSFEQHTAFGKTYRNLLPTREYPVKSINDRYTIEYTLEVGKRFNIIGLPYLNSIELKEEPYGWYQYAVYVDGFCPPPYEGLMLMFIDESFDHYRLYIHSHERKKYILRYNSIKPKIKIIQWSAYSRN